VWQHFEQALTRYQDLEAQLSDPSLASDRARFTRVAKEHGSAGKLVKPYLEFKKVEDDVATAEALAAACRLPPRGRRSFGPVRTALRRGDDPVRDADHVLVFAMIETAGALERAGDIAAVDGLDGLYIGPGDLGVALGLGPAQDREEPEIHDAFARVLDACRDAGTRAGVHATSAAYARARADDGFALVTVWSDVPAIAASLDASTWT
jgi:4-hydroxy-2-oxoheptanedioate aldolase